MRVLIVSEDGLPDIRVEKMINTLSKIVNEIYFVGDFRGWSGIGLSVKPKIYSVKWDRKVNLLLPPYFQWAFRKVKKVLESIRPDIVIACNLVAGYMIDKLGYPMIFDYHEVWSLQLKYISPPTLPRKLTYKRRVRLYPKLEELLLSKYPVITISNNARQYFIEKYGISESKIFVVKNYPSILEINNIEFNELDCKNIVFAYMGKDLVFFDGQTYRDLRPTLSVLDKLWIEMKNFKVYLVGSKKSIRQYIEAFGRKKHIYIYNVFTKTHFGILSYKPSPVHYLVNPNKAYMYSHSGSIPVITDTMKEIVSEIGRYSFIVSSINFEESLYSTYKSILESDYEETNKMRRRIFEYARQNLIWEKQEKTIFSALKSI
ncbi:MAG: glycosyltransferase [Staphylothermus sp.]|nr:glycosyltransferase [Staphylothermus sp.]